MRIVKSTSFLNMNEDAILESINVKVVGYDSKYQLYFTSADVFWFLDRNDHRLKVGGDFDTFTYMVADALEKSTLVEKLKDKNIVVFITGGKYPSYSFIGVYHLDQAFTEFSDNVGIEAYVPLRFKRVQVFYEG